MSRGAVATINLSAFEHNFARVKELAGHRSILAMIKSNGYGHGLTRVAKALVKADAFGVASLNEALTLRKAAIKTPIVVMAGFYEEAELPEFINSNLAAVIHRPDQVAALEKTNTPSRLPVWLKIDTGMHRLGFPVAQTESIAARLNACEVVQKPIGLMTHLADADNLNREFTESQIKQFFHAIQHITGPTSIVNSAGLLAYPRAAADWVRPGIMLYGVSPFAQRTGEEEGLRPVMTLSAKLIAIQHCHKDDAIGYGCTWRCPEAMSVGILGIGYGDGYPRHAKNGTPTLLNEKICPLIGRVSMDMIAIDLRAQPNAKVGDKVILWGEGLPVEKIAACADTIGYELLCNLTPRVEIIEVHDE